MGEGRVPRLEPEKAEAAAREAGIPDVYARLSVFQVLLRHPRLARAMHDLLATLLFDSSLDQRLRELVIMRIGWVTRSDYEWTQHWRIATGLGVPEADVLAVRDWRSHDGLGAADRAVLAAVDETLQTGTISPATWDVCRAALDEKALLELVAAIGNWRMLSSVLRSLDVPLEDGVASWPPDGVSPA